MIMIKTWYMQININKVLLCNEWFIHHWQKLICDLWYLSIYILKIILIWCLSTLCLAYFNQNYSFQDEIPKFFISAKLKGDIRYQYTKIRTKYDYSKLISTISIKIISTFAICTSIFPFSGQNSSKSENLNFQVFKDKICNPKMISALKNWLYTI